MKPLRRGNWSVQELERLRNLFPRRGVIDTAVLLRRSPESVRRKALQLLRVTARKGPWTDGDDELLARSWGVLEPRLVAVLVGRALPEVLKRAELLRHSPRTGPWTRREEARLKDLYGTRADVDLEVCLRRRRDDVVQRAAALCLAKDKRFAALASARGRVPPRRMPRWTKAEEAKLCELYSALDNLAVAKLLGRSVNSVANKANQLGFRKSPGLLTRIGRDNVAVRYRADGALGPVVPIAAIVPNAVSGTKGIAGADGSAAIASS